MKIDLPVALEYNRDKFYLYVEYQPVFDKDDVIGHNWRISYVGSSEILMQCKNSNLLLTITEIRNLIESNNYKELKK